MDTPYITWSLIEDIKEYLADSAPFETEDDVNEFIYHEIDTALIYTSNVREFAQEYDAMPDDAELISNFIDDLMTDVFGDIDPSEYVEEDEEDEE